MQVLKLCEKAGSSNSGIGADGTNIKANASKQKAMSYERMEKRAAELEAEVAEWLSCGKRPMRRQAYGRDKTRGDAELVLQEAARRDDPGGKAALEAEAKAGAEAKVKEEAAAEEKRQAEARSGSESRSPSGEPDPKREEVYRSRKPDHEVEGRLSAGLQRSAAVDAEAQIIVAQAVTQDTNDRRELAPMTDAIETNPGRKPEQLLAESGYRSNANIEPWKRARSTATLRPAGPRTLRTGAAEASMAAPPADASATASPRAGQRPNARRGHAREIKAGGHDTDPAAKQFAEPVFGQSSRRAGSANSCYGASKRCKRNGVLSAPHTLC